MPFTDPAEALQRAIVALLANAPAVVALIGDRVYDDVPADRVFPYVAFGPVSVIAETAECVDGADVSLQLDVWSEMPGLVEAKQIAAAVVDALHDAPVPMQSAGAVQSIMLETARYQRDPDGLRSRGILTFNILTDANA